MGEEIWEKITTRNNLGLLLQGIGKLLIETNETLIEIKDLLKN